MYIYNIHTIPADGQSLFQIVLILNHSIDVDWLIWTTKKEDVSFLFVLLINQAERSHDLPGYCYELDMTLSTNPYSTASAAVRK